VIASGAGVMTTPVTVRSWWASTGPQTGTVAGKLARWGRRVMLDRLFGRKEKKVVIYTQPT